MEYPDPCDRLCMKVQRSSIHKTLRTTCIFDFELSIDQINDNDDGIYFVNSKNGETRCTVLRMEFIVRDPQPLCTTHLENEHGTIRLSCEWLPRESLDNMDLVVGNQPLPSSSAQTGMNGVKTVISATFPLQDAFDTNHVPDACVVSNSDLGFQNQCIFSVYVLPSMNEITENGGQAAFICCSDNLINPKLWFYNEFLKRISYTAGQSLMMDLDFYRGGLVGENASVFFICGEGDQDGTNSYRMGKILFGSQFNTTISLKADMTRIEEASIVWNPGFQSCAHAYNISVMANYVEHESLKTFNPTNSQIFQDNYGVLQNLSTFPTNTGQNGMSSNSSKNAPLGTSFPFTRRIMGICLAVGFIILILSCSIGVYLRRKKLCAKRWKSKKNGHRSEEEMDSRRRQGHEGNDPKTKLNHNRRQEADPHWMTTAESRSLRIIGEESSQNIFKRTTLGNMSSPTDAERNTQKTHFTSSWKQENESHETTNVTTSTMISPVYQNYCKLNQDASDVPTSVYSSVDEINPNSCDGKSLQEYENCLQIKESMVTPLSIRNDAPSMNTNSLPTNERPDDNDRLAEEQNVYMDLITINPYSEQVYQSLR